MIKIGVLASTNATDLGAVIDAINSGKLNAAVSVIISNKKDAGALEKARKNKIKSVFLDSKGKEREQFDKEIAKILDENKVELILLIGYMRILSPWFVKRYKNRIINIHPSLLPKYPGGMDLEVHAEVLKNKEKVSGATLHFVDKSVDGGPIIMQKEVAIENDENPGTLKQKVQQAEQEIILKAIGLFSKNKI